MPSFRYRKQESRIFGKILRPLIDLEILSYVRQRWIRVENVLADTGADISLLPRSIGELVVRSVAKGKHIQVGGIVPETSLDVHLHDLKFRIDDIIFRLPVGIGPSDTVPPILGRVKGLDLFNARFAKGIRTVLE